MPGVTRVFHPRALQWLLRQQEQVTETSRVYRHAKGRGPGAERWDDSKGKGPKARTKANLPRGGPEKPQEEPECSPEHYKKPLESSERGRHADPT